MGLTAAAEWVTGRLLTRGKTTAQSIGAAGGTFDLVGQDGSAIINCVGEDTLVVEVDQSGAANGDLGVQVNPVEVDQATVMPIPVPVVQSVGPTFSGAAVYFYGQYDVSGLEAVRVRLTNNNAGGQTVNRASWRFA